MANLHHSPTDLRLPTEITAYVQVNPEIFQRCAACPAFQEIDSDRTLDGTLITLDCGLLIAHITGQIDAKIKLLELMQRSKDGKLPSCDVVKGLQGVTRRSSVDQVDSD